jgi:hypothetical protein
MGGRLRVNIYCGLGTRKFTRPGGPPRRRWISRRRVTVALPVPVTVATVTLGLQRDGPTVIWNPQDTLDET